MKVCIFCDEMFDRSQDSVVLLGVCKVCETIDWPRNVAPAAEKVSVDLYNS